MLDRQKHCKKIAKKRYTVIGGKRKSLSEWARLMGVSRQYAHQLYREGKLKERVQEFLSTA